MTGSEDQGPIRTLSGDDLHEAARYEGIRDLADVELAILEPNGDFSFFTRAR